MEFSIKKLAPETAKKGCIVVGVHQAGEHTQAARAVDQASKGAVRAALRDLSGKTGSTLLLRGLPGIAAERVLLVGLGEREEFAEAAFRDAVRAAAAALKELGAKDAALFLADLKVGSRPSAWNVRQAVLATREAFYRFDELKTQKKPPDPALVSVILPFSPDSQLEQALTEAAATADGAALARNLGNLPANLCTPTYLADEAKKIARQFKLGIDVLGRRDRSRHGTRAGRDEGAGQRDRRGAGLREHAWRPRQQARRRGHHAFRADGRDPEHRRRGPADPVRRADLCGALQAGGRGRHRHAHWRLRRRPRACRERPVLQRPDARRRDPRGRRRRLGPRLADAAVGGLPGAAALQFRRHGEHRRPSRWQRYRRVLSRAVHAQAALGAHRYRRHRLEERAREGLHRAAGSAPGAIPAAARRKKVTSIDFYFNAEDRLQVACRLAGKALARGQRMLIYAPEHEIAQRI